MIHAISKPKSIFKEFLKGFIWGALFAGNNDEHYYDFFSAEIVVLAENFLKGRLVKRQFSTTLTFWNDLKFIQWFKPVSVHMHNWFVIMAFAHLHWIGNQKGLF